MTHAAPAAPAPATSTTEKPSLLDQILDSQHLRQNVTPLLAGHHATERDEEYERVAGMVRLYARANPEILRCTRASIELAITKVAQWGLTIGDTAHLVPFNVNTAKKGQRPVWEKRLTPIADYKGLIQLMIASKVIRFVEAHCVYEKDEFDCVFGSERRLHHKPWGVPGERGALKGAWVMFHLPFGTMVWDYMPIEDIDAIRNTYSKQWAVKKNDNGEIVANKECPAWYAKKCTIRQASKLVPKDPRLARAMATIRDEERTEFGEDLDKIVATTQRMREEEELADTLNARLKSNVQGSILEGAEEEDDAELQQRLGGAGVAENDEPEDDIPDPLDALRQDLKQLSERTEFSTRSRELLAAAAENADLTIERALDMVDDAKRWLRKRELNLPDDLPLPKGAPNATRPSQAKLVESIRDYGKRYPHLQDTIGRWQLEEMDEDRLEDCLSILKDAAAVADREDARRNRRQANA